MIFARSCELLGNQSTYPEVMIRTVSYDRHHMKNYNISRKQQAFDCRNYDKLCGKPPQYARPLQVDLLTLNVVSESGVMCATFVPILVFLGLSVLYLRTRQTDVRHASSLNAPYQGRGHNKFWTFAYNITLSVFYKDCTASIGHLIQNTAPISISLINLKFAAWQAYPYNKDLCVIFPEE